MPKLCKLTAYSLFTGYVQHTDYKSAPITRTRYSAVLNSKTILFNPDEILFIENPYDYTMVDLKNISWSTRIDYYSYITISKDENFDRIAEKEETKENNNYYNIKKEFVYTLKLFKIVFKNPIPKGLGINGIEYDQSILIDEESMENLKKFLESSDSF